MYKAAEQGKETRRGKKYVVKAKKGGMRPWPPLITQLAWLKKDKEKNGILVLQTK